MIVLGRRRHLLPLMAAIVLLIQGAGDGHARIPAPHRYDCEKNLIEVMFEWNSSVRLRGGVPVDIGAGTLHGLDGILREIPGYEWRRICDVPEERLNEIQAAGEERVGRPVYNLNNMYRLRIPDGLDVWAVSRDLEALSGVFRARPVPRPVPPPLPPDYEPQQGYLDSAGSNPSGIDAKYAWTEPGGDGTGVTVCDLEYQWNYDHADVTKAVSSQINTNVADPGYGDDHGTAVIGELVSDHNGWGTTGACYASSLLTCGTYYGFGPSWNIPGAITLSIAALSEGDVILLEQQWDYNGLGDGGGYVPVEWWTEYYPEAQSYNGAYAAIDNAVSNGIHVVQAAGNGRVNLDTLNWYGDSGSIIVGAGGSATYNDRTKLNFSTFGSRVDLQGWGQLVTTTGYGDLYSAEGKNYWYTDSFNGTSSASPIITAAVASCVGYWKAKFGGDVPTPVELRSLLEETGAPQVTPPFGNIGPRPDLRAAFAALVATSVTDPGETAPPRALVLSRNVPNPFNPMTEIKYKVAVAGKVTLAIHDVAGRLVTVLVGDNVEVGDHMAMWNGLDHSGTSVASGTYFVRLESNGETVTRKITLVR